MCDGRIFAYLLHRSVHSESQSNCILGQLGSSCALYPLVPLYRFCPSLYYHPACSSTKLEHGAPILTSCPSCRHYHLRSNCLGSFSLECSRQPRGNAFFAAATGTRVPTLVFCGCPWLWDTTSFVRRTVYFLLTQSTDYTVDRHHVLDGRFLPEILPYLCRFVGIMRIMCWSLAR